MPAPSHKLRNCAEELIRNEIGRLGPDGISRKAIIGKLVAEGCSKTRAYAWMAELLDEARNPPPATTSIDTKAERTEEVVQAEVWAAAAETAVVLSTLPRAQETRAEVLARMPAVPPPGAAPITHETRPFHPIAMVPDATRGTLDHLQRIIEATTRVLDHAHGTDGKIRNPRVALQATESLRRCLETEVKLYERINNLQQVETFMREMLAEVRLLAPDLQRAVVERMRAVQRRWSS